MRRSKKTKHIGIIIALVLIVLAATIVVEFKNLQQLIGHNEDLKKQITRNTQTVYVATKMIEAGEKIEAEGDNANVELQPFATGLDNFNYIKKEELGTTSIVNIPKGIPVMFNMVTEKEITNDSRYYEMAVVNLMLTQKERDVIDVRIAYPNGEDYIILSKKTLQDLNMGKCIFNTQLNEEEILRIHSAIIDAYTTAGAKIYTTTYIENNIQEAAIPNYLVKPATIDLINSDPNIVTKAIETLNLQARLALEARLSQLTPEEKEKIDVANKTIEELKKGIQEDQQNQDKSNTDGN